MFMKIKSLKMDIFSMFLFGFQVKEKVRFGTFPRGFENINTDVPGNISRTFPRSSTTICRRPELQTGTMRSLMSRGSEGTISTVSSSSNSSGLPPDPDMDSPEGRLVYKRNSDLDSPTALQLQELSLSKCEYYNSDLDSPTAF